MFHLLAYQSQLAAAAADADLAAVVDSEFTIRNNHPIFTEAIDKIAEFYNAANATRARFNVPSWNTYGRNQIYPVLRSATIPDLPFVADYRDMPQRFPMNEEIAVEGSNDAGAGDETYFAMFIAAPGWNRNLVRGAWRFNCRATYTITSTANQWSAAGNLTFAENLKGGWYAVNGMVTEEPNVLYTRLIFPRGNVISGRRFRPGCLNINAPGSRPWEGFSGGMGVWGRFHSFEPPQVEILANNAAAHTGEVRLDLTYLGDTGIPSGV